MVSQIEGFKNYPESLFSLTLIHSVCYRALTLLFWGLQKAQLLPRNKLSHRRGHLLALPVLQIEVRIEVDEDPLVRARRRYHPCASLRGGIRHGVSGRGEVVGG